MRLAPVLNTVSATSPVILPKPTKHYKDKFPSRGMRVPRQVFDGGGNRRQTAPDRD
jgi:hypothetical protein